MHIQDSCCLPHKIRQGSTEAENFCQELSEIALSNYILMKFQQLNLKQYCIFVVQFHNPTAQKLLQCLKTFRYVSVACPDIKVRDKHGKLISNSISGATQIKCGLRRQAWICYVT